MALLALVGFTYTVVMKVKREDSVKDILIKALDLITIIVPPALPMAMTIGVIFAQNRLKKLDIFCISPKIINVSGCVNCICFDKTGTLTEDQLDFEFVIPSVDANFQSRLQELTSIRTQEIVKCMASCHSLAIVNQTITGDPLEEKMFATTGWNFQQQDNQMSQVFLPGTLERITLVKLFAFSSQLQRMSVLTRSSGNLTLYSKGAPEVIASLCLSHSLPKKFSEVLSQFTQQGLRVLALAERQVTQTSFEESEQRRDHLEKDLSFLGLLVMGNKLKPATRSTITELKDANIRCLMVTGDNIETALSVAQECQLIPFGDVIVEIAATGSDIYWHAWYANKVSTQANSISLPLDTHTHVAITGSTFEVLQRNHPELLKSIAVRGAVFARMLPDQKQQLIELLQELGYFVGMCGDGANDCGALKAAHAGVSLSDAEASIASPFTSNVRDISCMTTLIREGRASLVTSFGILKYMACYSICQFTSVIILYTVRITVLLKFIPIFTPIFFSSSPI